MLYRCKHSDEIANILFVRKYKHLFRVERVNPYKANWTQSNQVVSPFANLNIVTSGTQYMAENTVPINIRNIEKKHKFANTCPYRIYVGACNNFKTFLSHSSSTARPVTVALSATA